jgi:hypothetical protein
MQDCDVCGQLARVVSGKMIQLYQVSGALHRMCWLHMHGAGLQCILFGTFGSLRLALHPPKSLSLAPESGFPLLVDWSR